MHLEELSNLCGVSSDEGAVRRFIIDTIKPHTDEWHVDTMGNLFVTRHHRLASTDTKPLRVMVAAHMDEVGFMISKINDNGRLKFAPIGGFDRRTLLGKVVIVGKQHIPGVIGLKPVHLLKGDDHTRVSSIDSMYIDIGATDKKSSGAVAVGDFATFAPSFARLGGQAEPAAEQGRVKGKAFDDRAGCAVLLELLKEDYPFDLIAVFTVQEEVGLRGARVAAYAAEPDIAFVLECTAADDLPPEEEDTPPGFPRLGHGPAITVMDRSFMADRRLVDLLIDTAMAEKLPYQFKRPGIGGTDAGAVHLTREGVPSAVVSVPARYIHAPAAVLDLADFWHTVKLMKATLGKLNNWSN